jgi:hypothetical protein
MGELQIMDRSGHDATTWTPTDQEKARAEYATFMATYKGVAVRVDADMSMETITEFDPTADRILLYPQHSGG